MKKEYRLIEITHDGGKPLYQIEARYRGLFGWSEWSSRGRSLNEKGDRTYDFHEVYQNLLHLRNPDNYRTERILNA